MDEYKTSQHATHKGQRGDNAIYTPRTILELMPLLSIIRLICTKYSIRYVQVITILHLYRIYATTGKSVNVYGLMKFYNDGESMSMLAAMQERLRVLVDLGLIECIGLGKNQDKLYIPSLGVCNYLKRIRV